MVPRRPSAQVLVPLMWLSVSPPAWPLWAHLLPGLRFRELLPPPPSISSRWLNPMLCGALIQRKTHKPHYVAHTTTASGPCKTARPPSFRSPKRSSPWALPESPSPPAPSTHCHLSEKSPHGEGDLRYGVVEWGLFSRTQLAERKKEPVCFLEAHLPPHRP